MRTSSTVVSQVVTIIVTNAQYLKSEQVLERQYVALGSS